MERPGLITIHTIPWRERYSACFELDNRLKDSMLATSIRYLWRRALGGLGYLCILTPEGLSISPA
jgi:hypothetical protein